MGKKSKKIKKSKKLWSVFFIHEMVVKGDDNEEALRNALDGMDVNGKYRSHREAYGENFRTEIYRKDLK